MRIINLTDETKENILENLLKRSPNNYGQFADAVNEILDNVKKNGDRALFEYTQKFDKAQINENNILVTKEEIDQTKARLSKLVQTLQKGCELYTGYKNMLTLMCRCAQELFPEKDIKAS